jgi:hypothetical protein
MGAGRKNIDVGSVEELAVGREVEEVVENAGD